MTLPDKPQIGDTRPAGWFTRPTTFRIKTGWILTDFRRSYVDPHRPERGERWKPVWKWHA